ncbi:hypothetical protein M408DRAFT_295365 [Serendipita vermifera MAFF 305830]|uniref:Uncharacterized protein n=1 Tax=Serendipita vermifera MAFF 305830 TaxID=933852 RepID=A0A0C2WVP7_SERVB|nr:hypothetical protein M408DRAFT_295365 [Serendipita vermifera MAFF 305830]
MRPYALICAKSIRVLGNICPGSGRKEPHPFNNFSNICCCPSYPLAAISSYPLAAIWYSAIGSRAACSFKH